MFIAMHDLSDITNAQVRGNILTNIAIKFVAKTSSFIHDLCRSLGNCESELLTTLNDYEFAFFGPNMQQATVVKLPLVTFPRGTKPKAAEPIPTPKPPPKPRTEPKDDDSDTDWKEPC